MAKPSRVNDFIAFYQSIDVLIIDDIQDLMHKPGTQSAFFHMLQSSTLPESAPDNNVERLRTIGDGGYARATSISLQMGMTCELESPDFDLRVAKCCVSVRRRTVSTFLLKYLEYIAVNVIDSIRELKES